VKLAEDGARVIHRAAAVLDEWNLTVPAPASAAYGAAAASAAAGAGGEPVSGGRGLAVSLARSLNIEM
jgi:hypothetical protein